jgi:hypothetical protein
MELGEGADRAAGGAESAGAGQEPDAGVADMEVQAATCTR